MLTGDDWKTFYVRNLPLATGDVLAAKVRDDQGGAKGGFYLEASAGGAVILNMDRLKYTAAPGGDWTTNPDVSSWSQPQITDAAVGRGGETKSKVAWGADAGKGAGMLYFKVVIP